jgi:flagellar protein FlaJ
MSFPLLLVQPERAKGWVDNYRFLGVRFAFLRPGLDKELQSLGSPVDGPGYVVLSSLTALIYSLVIFALSYFALTTRVQENVLGTSIAYAFVFFVVFLILNLFYPFIALRVLGEGVDRELSFALRDMALQVEGGIPLYDTMTNVAESNYGAVSVEFGKTMREIRSGYSEKEALERMAVRNESKLLKKSLWQIVSVISSGASLAPALKSVAETVKTRQINTMKEYAASLNFLVWIYLLLSVVLPAMGITFIVVFASFSKDLDPLQFVYFIIGISVFLQVSIIGYIARTKPRLNK